MKEINNGELTLKDLNKKVKLYGWVAKKRNLGGIIFVDLRDRTGIIQLIIRPESPVYATAEKLKSEYVINAEGIVHERESKNPNIPTGDIEVEIDKLTILNESAELPFAINDKSSVSEDIRLKYRYLDLRRESMTKNIITRHKIVTSVREYLNNKEFLEIETPILCRSTPEGARDYLVPSRINKGTFYALPQSPQLLKQLLMVSGFEKYYQIAKCFRDEDLRADRQPEFTQIDMEMSFVTEEDVMKMTEGLIKKVFKDVKGIDISLPLKRMKYDDAMNDYGSDKPDTRFDMKINDITEIFRDSKFDLFKNAISENNIINCIVANNCASKFSRKQMDAFTDFVKEYRASGLIWLKYNDGAFTGSAAKNISEEEAELLKYKLNLKEDDTIFIILGKKRIVKVSLGMLRLKLGRELGLIDDDKYDLLWVVDFPLFEYNEEDGRYYASHHPFTSPKDEDIDKVKSDPGNCYAKAYDIVINGYEAGGGSIRIHDRNVQELMFEALSYKEDEIQNKFGFLMEAFKYGTPPHGGLAIGLERLTMLLCGDNNIRDVIAFPKTGNASCLMSEAPNIVSKEQLDELGIAVKKPKEN